MKSLIMGAMVLTLALGLLSSAALAVTVQASGMSVDDPVPVSMKAELTISDDILTLILSNTSEKSSSPSCLLGSYYFDIVNSSGERPDLALVSATGDVWRTSKKKSDVLETPAANLVAVKKGDYTWQFKSFDASSSPFLGFGVGTVGNSSLAPSNFNGDIVDGMDYSIYTGEVTTQNLDGRLLVKDSITFVFSGLLGFTDDDISHMSVFGLGTDPDTLLIGGGDTPIPPPTVVPEPLTMAMLGMGLAGLGRYVSRRRAAA